MPNKHCGAHTHPYGFRYTTTSSNSYCFNATDMPKGYNGFALKVVDVLTPPPAPNAICAGT